RTHCPGNARLPRPCPTRRSSDLNWGSDLDFGKTITFEFGIRHSFNEDMVLDISAYNKDNLSNAAGRLVSLYDPSLNRNVDIRLRSEEHTSELQSREKVVCRLLLE